MERSLHPKPRLVGMENGRDAKGVEGRLLKATQGLLKELTGPFDRPLADSRPEEIFHGLADAVVGKHLMMVEIGEEGQGPGTVLGGDRDTRWRLSPGRFVATWTGLGKNLVFGDDHPGLGDLEDLARLDNRFWKKGKIRTTGADRGGMTDDNIGGLDLTKRLSLVAGLSSGFLAGLFSKAFGRGLFKAIG